MKPAIRVENLSKHYKLGERLQGYKTLRESLVDAACAPFRRFTSPEPLAPSPKSSDFWALTDVSFEVQPGEVVGIIGRNGAGKSTLLKVLSRITEPTSGKIELRGRVGSLLEVGTGFHPELTGRENIYMNGSILGMTRREIAKKFDEIVDFAEIEEFLDTPVKRYSSGMYVRLAFAVAAHLQPEILIVDEVLAVGDQAFQRKCIAKMDDVRSSGHTVLLVSHTLSILARLCNTGLLLSSGRLERSGPIGQVVRGYHSVSHCHETRSLRDCERHRRQSPVLDSIELINGEGDSTCVIPLGHSFHCRIGVVLPSQCDSPTLGIGIDNAYGERALTLLSPLGERALSPMQGSTFITCVVQELPLAPGDYVIKLSLSSGRDELDSVHSAFTFTVLDGDPFVSGRNFHRGACIAPSAWYTATATSCTEAAV